MIGRTGTRLAAAMWLLSLAACATVGNDYDPTVVDQLKPGTPRAEVIRLLGQPTTTARLPDGRQQLMWVHSRATLGKANSRAVMLLFDADGNYLNLVSSAETNLR